MARQVHRSFFFLSRLATRHPIQYLEHRVLLPLAFPKYRTMTSYAESASHPGKDEHSKHPQPPQPEDTYHYKRIIVCCDGTWQRSDAPDKPTDPESNGCIPESNVARMGRSLKRTAIVTKDGKTFGVPQIVYYQSGIGTTYLTRLAARFAGKLRDLIPHKPTFCGSHTPSIIIIYY